MCCTLYLIEGGEKVTNEELVEQIQQGFNEKENMQQLYLQNKSLIYQIVKPYTAYTELDDLMQEAYFGLKNAVDSFDNSMGTVFITHAVNHIKAVVGRFTKRTGRAKKIPDYMIDLIAKYNRYCNEVREQGDEVTDQRICYHLGISQKKLDEVRRTQIEMNEVSIYAPVSGTEDVTVGDTLPDQRNIEDEVIDKIEQEKGSARLWEIVHSMKDEEDQVICNRYKKDMTLQQCSDCLGRSVSQIRRIEKSALKHLQNNIEVRYMAEIYKCYCLSYRGGLQQFKNTGTSSTEYCAIKKVELENAQKNVQDQLELILAKYAESGE